MFLFAQKNKRKKKNNDTLWHAFVININELRNEPRRIENKAGQSCRAEERSTHARPKGERQGSEYRVRERGRGRGRCQYSMHTVGIKYQAKHNIIQMI